MKRAGLLGSFLVVVFCTNAAAISKPKRPHGPIGIYYNGCIGNAVALPLQGEGYQSVRASRQHFYGHPQLVTYLQKLGRVAQKVWHGFAGNLQIKLPSTPLAKWLLGIGDLSAKLGGNIEHHGSHKTGLDADVPYLPYLSTASLVENEQRPWYSVVDLQKRQTNALWNPRIAHLLHQAAVPASVAYLFVDPAIKQAVCQMKWKNRAWLGKLYPLSNHHDHFHVRQKCPPGSQLCTPQVLPMVGDGCSHIDAKKPKKKPQTSTKAPRLLAMPSQCQSLLTSGLVAQNTSP